MKTISRAALFLFFCAHSVFTAGFSQTHHDAAQHLLDLTLPLKDAEITQTAIDRIVASRPDLADREDEIRALIEEFLASPDYLETGTQAVMRFFSEAELIEMNRAIEREGLAGSPDEQVALLAKYNRLLDKVEELLVNWFSRRLKSSPPVPKDTAP